MRGFVYLWFALSVCSLTALAAPPELVRYQARLADDAGVPITGTHDISFAVYDVESGGSALWTEGPRSVDVQAGVADILLGEVTPLPSSVFTSSDRWSTSMLRPRICRS